MLLCGEPIDACGQHFFHGGRDLDARHGLGQAIGPPLATQCPGLDQGSRALFQEEWVAFRPLDEHWFEGRERGVVPDESGQQLLGTIGGQRINSELGIEGLAAPTMLVFGPICQQQ